MADEKLEAVISQLIKGFEDGTLSQGAEDIAVLAASASYAKLTPTARQQYSHEKLLTQVQDEKQKLSEELERSKMEISRLQQIEIQFSELKQVHRSGRWTAATTAISMAVGGGLISSFQAETTGFGLGWGLLILGGLIQLGRSIFDW